MDIKFGRNGYDWKNGNPLNLNTDEPSIEQAITQDIGRKNANALLQNQAKQVADPMERERVYNQQVYDGEAPIGMNIDPVARNMIHNQARNEERGRQFQETHPGVSSEFAKNIAELLNQGRQAQARYEAQARGDYGPISVADIVRRNQEALGNSKDMAWVHQNPTGEGMGYTWNDEKMKALGWNDDDIANMKSITDMHPQMIQDLYNRGILKAPYREYLNSFQ